MSGKGELVRYTKLRAPKDPKDTNSMSWDDLKQTIGNLIQTASKHSAAKITIIALVEDLEDEKK